jgi:hypothetical protein
MELKGYDAAKMRKVLDVIHAVSPLNGIVTVFVDYDIERLLVAANFLWTDESGDVFEDYALSEWSRRGGDVRELAKILDLDIEITL